MEKMNTQKGKNKAKSGLVKKFTGLLLVSAFMLPNVFAQSPKEIEKVINQAHKEFKGEKGGKNADYIPYLKNVNSDLYGIAIVTADGKVYEVGDTKFEFGIESISKAFVLAMAMQQKGSDKIEDSIGVDATGMPFNSVTAIELEGQKPSNPFVNAGAMATNSIIDAKSKEDKWKFIMDNFNKFAGRDLKVIDELFKSEMATNQHNQAIALLLESYGRMYDNPMTTVELYTKQCSIGVNAKDLAIMAATFANNGVNPITKEKVLEPKYVPKVLSVMSTAGLYETTGEWLFSVGLPGKSGVGGGIIAVVPGVMGIAVFSPPLDEAGNSVRAQKAIEMISDNLGLNVFSAKAKR
ncbi:glutaminase [Sporocytophaga myxococcoides]|uniref:Glutaminase n=1 Tax=Sporocytophaga myxococcoides TaxID=153721 RepID=A0A098LNM6_9BACT|nr:glutaminase A [Sporocytophaga myxococcoides]GAL87718.1 glutaminase [Sporocytophaga myxococcoides]